VSAIDFTALFFFR